MKIIHTSDWHLGQSFFNKSREFEHQSFLDWLLAQAIEKKVDAIIVAGDIFDTTTPPSYARELYYSFVAATFQHKIQLVLLGGNHDSVAVLSESKTLFNKMNTFIIPSTGMALNEQVLLLKDKADLPGAVVCAVPFVRAHDVLKSQAGQSAEDKKKALEDAIAKHYQDLYALAQNIQSDILKTHQRGIPIIATGHLAAVGIKLSESVRDIYIGTLNGFSATHFPPANYIALGHIHKPQCIGSKDHIRYCGSPIALSFDEVNTQKEVSLVNFTTPVSSEKAQTAVSEIETHVESIAIPTFRRLAVIRGDLISINKQIDALIQDLNNESIWLSIEIEKDDYLSDLQNQIQNMIGDAAIEVLRLKRLRNKSSESLQQSAKETLEELLPTQVFEKRLAIENLEDKQKEQSIRERFSEILEELRLEGKQAIQEVEKAPNKVVSDIANKNEKRDSSRDRI